MTFAIDRTRSFLKIEESNLLALHRSTTPVIPSADYCRNNLCEAFICVVHEYKLHRVYLALHDQQVKANLVFIADPIKPDSKKLAALVQKATDFLGSIGFEMKQIDINFSSAMRQVIMKDIRVMREPSDAAQLAAARMAIENLIAEKQESSREQAALKAEREDLRKRLADAAALPSPATVLPVTAGNGADAALPMVSDTVHDDTVLRRLANSEEELLKVRTELRSVKDTLRTARDEAGKELKRHKHERDALLEKLRSGQAERDEARNKTGALRHELHEARTAAEEARHERMARDAAAEAAHQTETAALKAEIQRLTAERDTNDSTYNGEIEVLRTAFAEVAMALSVEKAKNESVLQEMDALELNASNELKLLKKKVESLTAEKLLLQKTAAEIKIKAHGEIERQQQVNQSQRKAAIKKLQALKEELRLLAEARAVIASPTGIPVAQSGTNASSLPPADSQHAHLVPNPFASHEAAESLHFLPDKSLTGIPYSCATDIIEMYRSYNTIQAAPTGKQSQRCDGFVCVVTEGGRPRVYVAWLMNSSGETLVCLPEQGAEEADCPEILRAGIGYFERVGFLIDRLHLEEDPVKRQVQLDGLAIFCRTVADCAA